MEAGVYNRLAKQARRRLAGTACGVQRLNGCGESVWRGLQGWTYLILDFPVGLGAAGIEVSDQVARKVCASIFDAKQRAESLHPRTKLTPTCVGTCHHNGQSVEPPMRNLGPTAGNHIPRVCNIVQVCLHRKTLLRLSLLRDAIRNTPSCPSCAQR